VGKSFEDVSVSCGDMNNKIQDISMVIQGAAENGDKIVDVINNVRDINNSSLTQLQEIATASEQQLSSMQQLSLNVQNIEKMCDDLSETINRKHV